MLLGKRWANQQREASREYGHGVDPFSELDGRAQASEESVVDVRYYTCLDNGWDDDTHDPAKVMEIGIWRG